MSTFARAEDLEVATFKYVSPLVEIEREPGGSLPAKIAGGWLGAEICTKSKVIFDIPGSRILTEPLHFN